MDTDTQMDTSSDSVHEDILDPRQDPKDKRAGHRGDLEISLASLHPLNALRVTSG